MSLKNIWNAFLKYNVSFLNHEIPYSFYIQGIWDETFPLEKDLIELHSYGIFTWASQPNSNELKYFNKGKRLPPKTVITEDNFLEFNHFMKFNQKAFLSFIVPKFGNVVNIEKLFDNLKKDKNIFMTICDLDVDDRYRGREIFSNFPYDDYFVTKTQTNYYSNKFDKIELEDYMFQQGCSVNSLIRLLYEAEFEHWEILDKCFYLQIVDSSPYNKKKVSKKNVIKILLKYIQKTGPVHEKPDDLKEVNEIYKKLIKIEPR